MPPTEPDPYAELENRADASELSEEFRKPVRVRRDFGFGRRPRGTVHLGRR